MKEEISTYSWRILKKARLHQEMNTIHFMVLAKRGEALLSGEDVRGESGFGMREKFLRNFTFPIE
jgi:hypothetical protein